MVKNNLCETETKNTLLRVIPTMTFQNSHVRFYVSLIVSGEGRHTTHLLKCVRLLSASQTDWRQSSDILSDMSFDILSDISSDTVLTFSLAYFWHSVWYSFWHSVWHSVWHSFWHIFWHSISRLRSGREHWAQMVAVEVRQETLGVAARGWGLTARRRRRAKEEWGRRQTTDIKSNNPDRWGKKQHLTSSEPEEPEEFLRKRKFRGHGRSSWSNCWPWARQMLKKKKDSRHGATTRPRLSRSTDARTLSWRHGSAVARGQSGGPRAITDRWRP